MSAASRAGSAALFSQALRSRRACRAFDASAPPVARAALLRLLELTQRATPSSFNAQPWSVVAVEGAAAKAALADAMVGGGNAARVRAAGVSVVFLADLEPSRRAARIAALERESGRLPEDLVAQLPLLIAGWAGEGKLAYAAKRIASLALSPLQPTPTVSTSEAWAYKHAAMAAQTYMLAASAHGLDTCPMEGFDSQRVCAALGVSERWGVPLIVATGTAADPPPSTPSPRLRPEEVLFLDTYGVPLVVAEEEGGGR
jgi:nitroreductase